MHRAGFAFLSEAERKNFRKEEQVRDHGKWLNTGGFEASSLGFNLGRSRGDSRGARRRMRRRGWVSVRSSSLVLYC